MKPRRHLSNKISAVGAATILAIALTGTTCGSFAWFMYASRAQIDEFKGVTIGVGELEAGIISEVDLPDAAQYGLRKDTSNPLETIYWFDSHEATSETISYILSMNGYATNVLVPVTSRDYTSGDPLQLCEAPRILSDNNQTANKGHYVHLPMVFRYADILEENTYISDENIYLSQFKLETTNSNSHIHEAIRVFTDNKEGNTHLINPSSSGDGATDVGGVLDLNGDGFYDALPIDGNDYEFIYGQVKESTYKGSPESDDTIIYPSQRTTFYAGHKAGVYALETCLPEKANFEGFYGFRNKRKPVTTTNPLTNNLAYLNLSIFVEGWDVHVIDSEIDVPFSMELKFEVKV